VVEVGFRARGGAGSRHPAPAQPPPPTRLRLPAYGFLHQEQETRSNRRAAEAGRPPRGGRRRRRRGAARAPRARRARRAPTAGDVDWAAAAHGARACARSAAGGPARRRADLTPGRRGRDAVWQVLVDAAESGTACLVATHEEEIARYANRVWQVDSGVVRSNTLS